MRLSSTFIYVFIAYDIGERQTPANGPNRKEVQKKKKNK